ncbi:unnamed protein product [Clavelina lepadiformis]|uniref:Biogenesis of lysosome-related organelles complex 1 subunit 6 n=1 Tax=Clavelina lepadiformis TaxID=159417 RepID=A0ABP0GWQ6_CLALP
MEASLITKDKNGDKIRIKQGQDVVVNPDDAPIADENVSVTSSPLNYISVTTQTLASLFVSQFATSLNDTESKLNDIQQNQNVLIESLHQERQRLNDHNAVGEVESAMTHIHHYQMKLAKIKKDMSTLKEISQRLRKKAVHLKQQKENEELKKREDRERCMEEDRKLIAKPVLDSSTKS